jgi:tetratricopeptide (TPR) repeat protein
MNKKIFSIGGGVVLLLLLLAGGWLLLAHPGDSKRANILKLARDYAAQGEDQRALDLLDQLLISNADDPDAKALRDQVVQAKRDHDNADKQAQLDALKNANGKLQQGLQSLANQLAQSKSAPQAGVPDDEAQKKAQRQKEEADRLAKEKAAADKLSADDKAKRDLFNQGMGLLTDSKYPEAKSKFDEVLDKDPEYADALIRKGEATFRENKSSPDARRDALALLGKGLTKNPKSAPGYAVQGEIYEESRNWPEAATSYTNALKNDPSNAAYWYELGKIRFLAKQYQPAVEAFQTSVKYDATNPSAFYLLGGSYFNMKDDKHAYDAYQSAIKLKPDAPYFYWSARSLANQGKLDLAIKDYEAAVKLDPSKASYQGGLGSAYYQSGRYTDAEAALQRALAADNKNAEVAYNLSLTEYKLNKTTQALDYAQKSVALDATDADYAYNLGFVLGGSSPDLAATAYRNAIKLDPQRVDARVNLATLLQNKGDTDGAMTLLKEAYDIAPANLEVNNNLGKLYMTKELYTQAIDFFKTALDKKTDTPTIRFNLALAYIATNQKDLAKTVLQDLIKLNEQYWDAYYRLGGVLYDLGDADGGKKVYQDLLAKDPTYPKKDEIQGIISK